jgi:hypothetical protein
MNIGVLSSLLFLTQKHGCRKKKLAQENIRSDLLKQMHFIVNDETVMTLEYFNLRTIAVFQQMNGLPEDGQVRPKHAVV